MKFWEIRFKKVIPIAFLNSALKNEQTEVCSFFNHHPEFVEQESIVSVLKVSKETNIDKTLIFQLFLLFVKEKYFSILYEWELPESGESIYFSKEDIQQIQENDYIYKDNFGTIYNLKDTDFGITFVSNGNILTHCAS